MIIIRKDNAYNFAIEQDFVYVTGMKYSMYWILNCVHLILRSHVGL